MSRQSGGNSGGNGPPPGSDPIVGNYRIGGEIGSGSFATVYKGHHIVS
jgi:serine/threonine protein kinase